MGSAAYLMALSVASTDAKQSPDKCTLGTWQASREHSGLMDSEELNSFNAGQDSKKNNGQSVSFRNKFTPTLQ